MKNITWTYHEDRSFPHLSCYRAEYCGIKLQCRLLVGCDYNTRPHQITFDTNGNQEPRKYLFTSHITFPNVSNQPLRDLKVDSHSIGQEFYRATIEEVQFALESQVIDMVAAIKATF